MYAAQHREEAEASVRWLWLSLEGSSLQEKESPIEGVSRSWTSWTRFSLGSWSFPGYLESVHGAALE